MFVFCEKDRDYCFIQFLMFWNSIRIYLSYVPSTINFNQISNLVLKSIIKRNPKFLELNKERIKFYVANR